MGPLFMLSVYFLWRIHAKSSSRYSFTMFRANNENAHGNNVDGKGFLPHAALYAQVRRLALDNGLYPSKHENENNMQGVKLIQPLFVPKEGPNPTRQEHILGPTYGANITQCDLTVLFMDPRIANPDYGAGEAGWFALESVGAFASFACVALLTSSCQPPQQENSAIRDEVYRKALPLFREMMNQGRVRLSFLDHAKYGLESCSNYGNPTAALVNHAFWIDEFLDPVDSDVILHIQADAVLCRPLDAAMLQHYTSFAYVGSVWPRESNPVVPIPPQGMCEFMPELYKSWIRPLRHRSQRVGEVAEPNGSISSVVGGGGSGGGGGNGDNPFHLPLEFPMDTHCRDGMGPVGNGGLSLRNRTWMQKAIRACPSVQYSGLLVDFASSDSFHPCMVFDVDNEDIYYGVILKALGAPLPKALDASLFSAEYLWPELALLEYPRVTTTTTTMGNNNDNNGEMDDPADPTVWNRWKNAPKVVISPLEGHEADTVALWTVPYGLHKPWYYSPNELLLSPDMAGYCPFLNYIFEPRDTKWFDFSGKSQIRDSGSVGQ